MLAGLRATEGSGICRVELKVYRGQRVFANLQLGRLVVAQLRALENERLARTLAWVLMPDGLHWLVALRTVPLPTLLCRLKSRSCRHINDATGQAERLWEPGYQADMLASQADPRVVARQLIQAPVRAGMVARVGDYSLWDARWL